MPGKRLFIAVDIDAATRAQVERISSMLRSKLDTAANASWVRSDRMHLTLHFVGSADAAVEEQVRTLLARPISQAPFDVAFDGLGCFPHRGTPRVLWLGISAGVDALRRLHTAFDVSALPRLLPKRSAESFTPHLTLARFRDRVPGGLLAKILENAASAGPSRIDRVTLYESRLSPAGPAYIPLAEAHLRQ